VCLNITSHPPPKGKLLLQILLSRNHCLCLVGTRTLIPSVWVRTCLSSTKTHPGGIIVMIFRFNFSNIYQSDHRKSSGTLSGTWTNASTEATYVPSTHGYEEAGEQRADSLSSKHVFGMLKTEDGQFPFLSNLAESVFQSIHYQI
jgi:hypothetical protein